MNKLVRKTLLKIRLYDDPVKFVWPEWYSAQQMCEELESLRSSPNIGDIYATFASQRQESG